MPPVSAFLLGVCVGVAGLLLFLSRETREDKEKYLRDRGWTSTPVLVYAMSLEDCERTKITWTKPSVPGRFSFRQAVTIQKQLDQGHPQDGQLV